ncbi:MAG: excinuclease ABC subunit UvrC [Acidiferrobacteraceae bacterium]|jgi:excinuclease ABC subunit C
MSEASFDPKTFVASLPRSPGVYRMMGADDEVLYIGKAHDLRARVGSYFRNTGQSLKTAAMVRQIQRIETTVTHTESEALLLENDLIKHQKPRFNVMLRDDKSYPYIYLSTEDEYPRLDFHRGPKRRAGRYFGPYPSASSVRESLSLLQKTFGVRQCQDSFFSQRSRPCLQYQIQRCRAPCVGLVSAEDYARDVRRTEMFLEGRSQALIEELVVDMERAAGHLEYEQAARIRDHIAALKRIQEKQYVSAEGGDLDVVAAEVDHGAACVHLSMVRDGRQLGSRQYFPRVSSHQEAGEVLAAFLSQHYAANPVPAEIYVSHGDPEYEMLEMALGQREGRRIRIVLPTRGAPRRWIKMAMLNAHTALRQYVVSRASLRQRFQDLQDALGLDAIPERVECFDISHTLGEATVASCVVFNQDGPLKSDYRRYNIEGVEPGDDYGAMEQVLTRRYRKMKEGDGTWPDVILIDGGKGQLARAEEVMRELQIGGLTLVGVAKGRERKPGMERLFLSASGSPTILPADAPALHLIQQIRDEAHRFAITGHRQRRGKARTRSRLESVAGVGEKRRQALLKHFGGMQGVGRAGIEDLAAVPGVSPELAQRIYDAFHGEDR